MRWLADFGKDQPRKARTEFRFIAAIALGSFLVLSLPLVMLVTGVWWMHRELWLRDHCLRAVGTVVAQSCDDGPPCEREIVFRDSLGANRHASSSTLIARVGEDLSVCFVPGAEPVQVYFAGDENGGALIALMGFALLAYLVRMVTSLPGDPRPALVLPLQPKHGLAAPPSHSQTEQDSPSLADALECAARLGDTERVRKLLNDGADPYRLDWHNHSPLTAALGQRHFETAQVLLGLMPDPAKRRSRLKTALRISVYAQDFRSVRYILGQAPDIYDEAEDSTGESPLEGAATRGNAELLRLLLARGPCQVEGASSTHEDPLRDGHTPLMSAVLAGGLNAVCVLVDAGANLRARERRSGYTPLIFACYLDKRGEAALIAGYLLERGAELDVRVRGGCTPLMVAVRSGGYDVIETLLRFGPDLLARDENDGDVFDVAQARGDPRVGELLARHRRGSTACVT